MEETLHIELCEMKDKMDFEWYENKGVQNLLPQYPISMASILTKKDF